MEPETGTNRFDLNEWSQLAEYLREPLLRAATEVLKAMAELPSQRVDAEGVGLGASTDINLSVLSEHLRGAVSALSLADSVRETLVAELPVGVAS